MLCFGCTNPGPKNELDLLLCIADVKHIWISKFSQKKVFFSTFDNIEKCLTDQNERVSNYVKDPMLLKTI